MTKTWCDKCGKQAQDEYEFESYRVRPDSKKLDSYVDLCEKCSKGYYAMAARFMKGAKRK